MMQIFDEWNFATSLRMNTNYLARHIRINQQLWLQNSRFEIRLIDFVECYKFRSIRSFFSLLVIYSFPMISSSEALVTMKL